MVVVDTGRQGYRCLLSMATEKSPTCFYNIGYIFSYIMCAVKQLLRKLVFHMTGEKKE